MHLSVQRDLEDSGRTEGTLSTITDMSNQGLVKAVCGWKYSFSRIFIFHGISHDLQETDLLIVCRDLLLLTWFVFIINNMLTTVILQCHLKGKADNRISDRGSGSKILNMPGILCELVAIASRYLLRKAADT